MFNLKRGLRSIGAVVTLTAIWVTPMGVFAQDLVTVSSITGGTSVFVFRKAAKAVKRVISAVKPNRSKTQRMESVARIKRQYEAVAKTSSRRVKAQTVDPTRIPPNTRSLPAEQGAKIFAGVGEYYIGEGSYDEAIQFFRDALSLDSKNKAANEGLAEALAMKGNVLLANEKLDLAKGNFLEALKFDPLNTAANFGLGEVYSELDQTDDAIASYERSLSGDPNLTEIYVPLGILYYQKGEIAKADDLLTKALAIKADSAETQFFLGLVRAAQNRTADALAAFTQAKRLDPNYAEAFYNSGEMLVRDKKFEEAVPDYLRAVEIKPMYLEAWVGLGEAYYELKKFPEAVEAYKKAVGLKNDNWEIFTALADANREAGSFNDAASNYNLAILFLTRDPNHSKATLAELHSKTGFSIGQQCDIDTRRNIRCRWPSVIKSLETAAELTNDPIDYVNLGWAYFRVAHPEAELKNMSVAMPNLILAKAALDKALTGSPEVVEYALQNMAAVQIDMGDQDGAIDTLSKLIRARPQENYLRYQLGVAYFKKNDFASSERSFREALEIDPNYVFALTGLGEALIGRRNGKEVKKVIDRLKPLDPAAADRLELKLRVARL